MKILHIISSLQTGGAERICLDIVKSLQKQENIEVKLILLKNVHHYKSIYPDVDYEILNDFIVPSIINKWQVKTSGLDRIMSEFKPDIVHSHLFQADFISHYKPVKGVKYFTHFHDNMHQLAKFKFRDLKSKKRLGELYERNFMLGRYKMVSNHFIAISKHTEHYLQEMLSTALRKNIHFLSNSIDLENFEHKKEEKSTRKIRLVNISSFVPKKNQKFLVDVASELIKSKLDFELLLAGDGPLLEEVKKYAIQKNCMEHIVFLGNTEKIKDLLSSADIYVHAATYEPFGLVFLEAMASGIPVIGLDGGGNRDIIIQGKNGYLIHQPDQIYFSKKILELTNNKNLYNSISIYCREFVKQYDINLYTQKLIKLYKNALIN